MSDNQTTLSRAKTIERRLGDLAGYSGLYAASGVAAVFVLSGLGIPPLILLGAYTSTVGVYVIDRIKLCDRDLDPADLEANHRRHAFLRSNALVVRAFSLGCVAASVVLLAWVQWWLGVLPILGVVSALLYTRGRVPGKRLKDRLLLKNAVIALAIPVLAGASLLGTNTNGWNVEIWVSLAWLGVVILADAALSDLDDQNADSKYLTRTLPTTLGRRWTWGVALGIQAIAGAGLIWALVSAQAAPIWPGLVLGAGIPISTGAMFVSGCERIRDPLDLRLPLLALLALVLT